MSLYHRKEALMSEPLPCPECGKVRMKRIIETCRLHDGIKVKRLRHYKCSSCGARFFDDDAMQAIRSSRTLQASHAAN